MERGKNASLRETQGVNYVIHIESNSNPYITNIKKILKNKSHIHY